MRAQLALGILTLLRPSVLLYAVQSGAVVGYTLTAAFNVPELTIDHCAPLVKNLPVLGCVVVLWLAEAAGRRVAAGTDAERGEVAVVRPWRPSPPLRPATRDVPA